jgi:hypothetical protein
MQSLTHTDLEAAERHRRSGEAELDELAEEAGRLDLREGRVRE